MGRLYTLALFTTIFAGSLITCQYSHASSPNVVISQVQLGNIASAKNEFVEIYNNSSTDVEITDWCLYYQSSGLTQSKMACFTPDNADIHIFLPSHSFALAVSNELSTAASPINGDIKFSFTLSGTGGYVRLADSSGSEVDKVGWGVSTPEINLVAAAPAGKILNRKTIAVGVLQDTNINSDDFEIIPPRTTYTYGSIYEMSDICRNITGIQTVPPAGYTSDNNNCYPPPVDICRNLDGLQIVVPSGYLLDNDGNCQVDICLNIDGLQSSLPVGMELDNDSNCVVHDECSNLSGIQTAVPDGFTRGDDNSCTIGLLPLKITELLPNAIGSDDGNEFIEIYNPNSNDINLLYYFFYVGSDYTRTYNFPVGSHIGPGQYMAFSNDDIKFTLVNTTGSVRLRTIDNYFTDETPVYNNPGAGMAWALINGTWQYTNQPTPGSVNLPSIIEVVDEVVIESELKPCAANQYRNLETNRCRLLPTSDSILAPCKDGQYRSEETNRCRSIASDVATLIPCSEDQERNPATNRCRSIILASSDLKPCGVGQERNLDTNRCRNVASAIPQAEYKPEQTNQSSNNNVLLWSLIGVGVVAIGYGVWEWRQEVMRLVRKVSLLLYHRKK